MSESASSGSTPFTVFDYLGLAFILAPPGVAVEALMRGEPWSWSYVVYGIPAVLIGAACIYIGRHWTTLKKGLWIRIANFIDTINRHSYVIAIMAFAAVLILVALAPLCIWPPSHENPAANNASVLSADEIADAVVRKLPPSKPPIPAPGPAVSTSPPEPYVNPLHSQITKWRISSGLRYDILRSGLSDSCRITISRLQLP